MKNPRLGSRMRENRPYGPEGGEGEKPFPTPIPYFLFNLAIKLDVSQRLPPIACTSA
jgi:hypothetical protein